MPAIDIVGVLNTGVVRGRGSPTPGLDGSGGEVDCGAPRRRAPSVITKDDVLPVVPVGLDVGASLAQSMAGLNTGAVKRLVVKTPAQSYRRQRASLAPYR